MEEVLLIKTAEQFKLASSEGYTKPGFGDVLRKLAREMYHAYREEEIRTTKRVFPIWEELDPHLRQLWFASALRATNFLWYEYGESHTYIS